MEGTHIKVVELQGLLECGVPASDLGVPPYGVVESKDHDVLCNGEHEQEQADANEFEGSLVGLDDLLHAVRKQRRGLGVCFVLDAGLPLRFQRWCTRLQRRKLPMHFSKRIGELLYRRFARSPLRRHLLPQRLNAYGGIG